MASTISNSLQKALNVNGSSSNAKLADLAKDTVNSEDKNARITTDFGVKVSNTDHWLTASTEDRQGPSLLEDFHGREKVSDTGCYKPLKHTHWSPRFTDSITNVSLRELSTPAALVHSELSNYLKVQRMLPRPAS